MANRVEEFLRDCDDPKKFVKVAGVSVFDEHDEPYWCLPDGRTEYQDARGKTVPVTRRTPDAEKRVRKFTPEKLRQIAKASNAEDAAGNFSPLSIGHQDPDETDETALPPQVGYARNYRVEYDPVIRKQAVVTDFYFHADDFDAATPYGAISIELWPGSWNIWPIALLKRAPQRSLPRWHYRRVSPAHPSQFTDTRRRAARPGYVLRYSMESAPMADDFDDDATDAPDEPATPLDGGADGVPTLAEHEQYARHCSGHPLAMKFAKHYAMADAPDEEPLDDPTEPPDADAEPDRFAAAFPSATNAGLPGDKKAKPFAKPGTPRRTVKQNAEAIQYAKLQGEVEELKKENAANRALAARENSEKRVTQLLAEGFDLDAEDEVLRFSKLNDAGRDEAEAYIRKIARKAPIGRTGRVPLAKDERPGDASPLGDISAEHSKRALAYMKTNRLPSDRWDEAVEATKK